MKGILFILSFSSYYCVKYHLSTENLKTKKEAWWIFEDQKNHVFLYNTYKYIFFLQISLEKQLLERNSPNAKKIVILGFRSYHNNHFSLENTVNYKTNKKSTSTEFSACVKFWQDCQKITLKGFVTYHAIIRWNHHCVNRVHSQLTESPLVKFRAI